MAARRHRRSSHHRSSPPRHCDLFVAPEGERSAFEAALRSAFAVSGAAASERPLFETEATAPPATSPAAMTDAMGSAAGNGFSAALSRAGASRVAEARAANTRAGGWNAATAVRAQKCMGVIHALAEAGRYEFGAHVESHMIEEGFDKEHCLGAVLGGRVLEIYTAPQQRRERERYLVAGRFHLSARNTCPLHIVCELFDLPPTGARGATAGEAVRFVTAYIPRLPEWVSPHTRASRS